MSNNGIPPLNDWQADNYPVIYDESESKLNYVKTGSKIEISTGGGSSYLVYVALLTQSATSAPVATVLENTLSGPIVWTRLDVGEYQGTLASAFDDTKTTIITSGKSDGSIEGYVTGANTINVDTYLETFAEDDLLTRTAIEIRVYP